MKQYCGTTILSVRRNGMVVIGGDGQVTHGHTVMKSNARKVRRLYNGKVLVGFAGGTADAFTCLNDLNLSWKPIREIWCVQPSSLLKIGVLTVSCGV